MKRLPKKYGRSQEVSCACCGSRATSKNVQGLPMCRHHVREEFSLRCLCGEWLDVRESKYGVFFSCMSCGAVSYARGLEMNSLPLSGVDGL